eukprot:m.161990 g.161990  ORF g.161990 m.161990 type:complete len:154 (+) comp38826_c0_seq3:840-1301(+)
MLLLGPITYDKLRDLVAPNPPKEMKLDDLMAALKNHFSPKPLVIAERFEFYKRQQRAGESAADFLVALRRLATHCEFGATLDDHLRDMFVVVFVDPFAVFWSYAKVTLPRQQCTNPLVLFTLTGEWAFCPWESMKPLGLLTPHPPPTSGPTFL